MVKICSLLADLLLLDSELLLPFRLLGVDVHLGVGVGLSGQLTPMKHKSQFDDEFTYFPAIASLMITSASFSASSRFLTLSSMFVNYLYAGDGLYNNIILLLLIQYVNFFRQDSCKYNLTHSGPNDFVLTSICCVNKQ